MWPKQCGFIYCMMASRSKVHLHHDKKGPQFLQAGNLSCLRASPSVGGRNQPPEVFAWGPNGPETMGTATTQVTLVGPK